MKTPLTLLALALALPSGAAFATSGKSVFEHTCVTCHGTGVMGAPKFGNKDDWAPRIAQGRKVLVEHADYGYKNMPPHGGNDDLSEKDVEAAIDYMVGQVGGFPADKPAQ
jgi:cytochrome c5